MSYCMKCGAKLPDGAKFCTVCGTKAGEYPGPAAPSAEPVPAPAADVPASGSPKKPRKFRLGLLIAIVAVVMVLGGAIAWVFSSGVLTPAHVRFVNMHRDLIDPVVEAVAKAASMDREELYEKMDLESKLDTDVRLTLDVNTGNDMADDIIRSSSILFKVKTREDEPGLFGFTLNLKGSDVLSGTFVQEEDAIGIYLPELDDEYYRLRFDDLAAILEDAGVEGNVEQILSGFNSGKPPFRLDEEELTAIADEYLDLFFSMVNKNNTKASREKVRLPALGDEISCTVLTFAPTGDEFYAVMQQLCEKLAADQRIRDMVVSFYDYSYSLSDYSYYYDDVSEYVDEMMAGYDETMDGLWENSRDDIRELADAIDEKHVTWKIVYKGSRIHQICLESMDGDGIGWESAGNVLDARRDVLAQYTAGKPEKIAENTVSLKGKTAEGSLRVNQMDEGSLRFDYSVDTLKRSGLRMPYCDLRVRYGGMDYRFRVSAADKGSMHDLEMNFEGTSVNVGIWSSDEPSTITPPSGRPTPLTVDNYQDVLMAMSDRVESLFYDLFG